VEEKSKEGSVWARGVVGRREEVLSSEALLSWRERVLESLMLSVSSWMLMACMSADDVDVLRVAATTRGGASSSITSTGDQVGVLVELRRAEGGG
jgi:hypothetical protein